MVFIFDSHPVQYKAPVYQQLETFRPGLFSVVYVTDCSLRGYHDPEFGVTVSWDTPLLEGYSHVILNNERGVPLSSFRSLKGRGVYRLIKSKRPGAVIISQFLYEADFAAYFSCLWLGIPVWIRQETQDEAFRRPFWKKIVRSLLYRMVYHGVDHAFYFGQLNREHLLRHGIPPQRMSFSPFCTVSPTRLMDDETKDRERWILRNELGIATDETLVLFSGKLIEKKNPRLILEALQQMPLQAAKRFKVVFVGSGELENSLKAMAGQAQFAGFVNQTKITSYYLAADILVLPSRQEGETWGLVVNEALQTGCSVIMTDKVGCHREFENWERVRVIQDEDAQGCARAMRELAKFPRSFDWCATRMEKYSVATAAEALLKQIEKVEPLPPSSGA